MTSSGAYRGPPALAPGPMSVAAPGPMSTDALDPTPAVAGVKRSADDTSTRGTHGRSLRARDVSRQPYVDDDPNLVAALSQSERRDKAHTSTKAHEGDLEAAKDCGMPPYELASFEQQCSALPVALRQQPARLLALRNHMLSRSRRAGARWRRVEGRQARRKSRQERGDVAGAPQPRHPG